MRTVTMDITKLGLTIGDTITIRLVNIMGGMLVDTSGYLLDSTITTTTTTFSIELLENEFIETDSIYKIILPSSLSFTFKVPFSQENIPHDMLALMRLGCTENIINEETRNLESGFVEKLDIYFAGNHPRFSKKQEDVVALYMYYADAILDTSSTIDIMKMMDEYLSTIKGDI